MSCCSSCAVGATCESGCEHHDHVAGVVDAYVGDIGTDIANAFRVADDFISTAVVEPVLDALGDTPAGAYTNIIRDVHDARREAQERAAPRTGPGGIPGLGPSPRASAAAPAGSPAPVLPGPRPRLATSTLLRYVAPARLVGPEARARATIRELQAKVRGSRKGDSGARVYLDELRARALRGDAAAKREWSVAVLVMRDDDAAARRAAVAS